MPEAVLFDLYDTLVVSDWGRHASFLSERLGVPAGSIADAYGGLREARDGGGLTDAGAIISAVASHCGVRLQPERVEEIVAAEAEYLRHNVAMYDDTVGVLRRLAAEGVRTAIVSNCSPTTRPIVGHLGLEAEVDAVVLSCEVGTAKPDPEIFEIALARVEAEPNASWFVDDRSDYLDGARRLGIRTARIVRPVSHGEEVPGGEHPVIDRLAGIFDLY